ncbi:MAG: Fic family protein [Luteolibacter sp.]
MPYQIPASEFDQLTQIIASRSNGASVKELLLTPEVELPKRTLQRRLEQLVSEGKLRPEGEGRARRYRAIPQYGVSQPFPVRYPVEDWRLSDSEEPLRLMEDVVSPSYQKADWLSPDGRAIRDAVNRPLFDRIPVPYKHEFLDAYRPNETFYLPEYLQEELGELGQVGFNDLPAGTYVRQVLNRLLIDLSWNSSRLEGNTYSILETQRLVEFGESAEGRAVEEAQMILNHKAAIEMLVEDAAEIDFNHYTICNLHALLADGLLPDPSACGRVRSRPVGIGGTVFHPLNVPQQLEERFSKILEKARQIRDPFEQAFFVMVHLPYLQPFEDVNKRVSRLATNIPLIRQNLCPLSFVDVDRKDYIGGLLGVYELNRVEYLRDVFVQAYRRSCGRYSAVRQVLGDPDPFRLRHRALLGRLVREVVVGKMDKRVAAKWIARESVAHIGESERPRFIELVETELTSLHSGNIARYRLRPSEFDVWIEGWR